MDSVELSMPRPPGPWSSCDLWPFELKTDVFILIVLLKCINTKSLVKCSPVIFKISRYQGKILARWTTPRLWTLTFWPQNLTPSSLFQSTPNAESLSNTFRDIVFTTSGTQQPENNDRMTPTAQRWRRHKYDKYWSYSPGMDMGAARRTH